MMKALQITFLWMAGLLILGHNVIPHHHHESEQEACHEQHHESDHNHDHDHHNDFNLQLADDCCQDEDTQHNACNLNQRTIVKDQNAPIALLVGESFQLPNSHKCNCALNHNYKIGIVSDAFRDESPSRAPPKV